MALAGHGVARTLGSPPASTAPACFSKKVKLKLPSSWNHEHTLIQTYKPWRQKPAVGPEVFLSF